MKYLFLLLIGLTIISSCEEDGKKRSPQQTCEKFLNKIGKKEFDAAKKYTSRATDPYMDLLTTGTNIFTQMNQKGNNFQAITTIEDENMLTYNCTTTGEKSICKCIHKDNKDISFAFHLIQENGQWVIHQPKETTVE